MRFISVALLVLSFSSRSFGQGTDVGPRVLASGLPVRPAQAVFVDKKIYFTAERTGSGCLWGDIYSIRLDESDHTKTLKRVGVLPCVIKLIPAGDRLFVSIGDPKTQLLTVENDRLVGIQSSRELGTVFANRLAWLNVELVRWSDRLKDPSIKKATVQQWAAFVDHPTLGPGTVLAALLRSETGRWFYGYFPLEDTDRSRRFLVALPSDTFRPEARYREFSVGTEGKVLLAESSHNAAVDGRILVMNPYEPNLPTAVVKTPVFQSLFSVPVPAGWLMADSLRTFPRNGKAIEPRILLVTAEKAEFKLVPFGARDVSGLFPLEEGVLITRGWERSLKWFGRSPLPLTVATWTAEAKLVVEGEIATGYPREVALHCPGYSLSEETDGWFAFRRTNADESFPLAYLSGLESLACDREAVGFLAKTFSPVLTKNYLTLDLEADDYSAAKPGTNHTALLEIAAKVEKKEPLPDNLSVSAAKGPTFFLIESQKLTLVREPLADARFSRVRSRGGAPGFLLWSVFDTGAPFSRYLNEVSSNGRDFWEADLEKYPFPEPSRQFLEKEPSK